MNQYSSYLPDNPKILSVREVSEILYVGKNKVYQMLEVGQLKGFKVGKLWRVCSSDIDNFIREHYSMCG